MQYNKILISTKHCFVLSVKRNRENTKVFLHWSKELRIKNTTGKRLLVKVAAFDL